MTASTLARPLVDDRDASDLRRSGACRSAPLPPSAIGLRRPVSWSAPFGRAAVRCRALAITFPPLSRTGWGYRSWTQPRQPGHRLASASGLIPVANTPRHATRCTPDGDIADVVPSDHQVAEHKGAPQGHGTGASGVHEPYEQIRCE